MELLEIKVENLNRKLLYRNSYRFEGNIHIQKLVVKQLKGENHFPYIIMETKF